MSCFQCPTARTQTNTLSLHDALPISAECLDRAADVDVYEPGHQKRLEMLRGKIDENRFRVIASRFTSMAKPAEPVKTEGDRKSTRLNSSHVEISYAVFCLKKKKKINE